MCQKTAWWSASLFPSRASHHVRVRWASLAGLPLPPCAALGHGIHAITSRIVPAPGKESQGFHMLEAENFVMHVKMTETGTKFVLLAPTTQTNAAGILQRAYELYVEHVMKNPFYIAEMPIRVEAFDREMHLLLR